MIKPENKFEELEARVDRHRTIFRLNANDLRRRVDDFEMGVDRLHKVINRLESTIEKHSQNQVKKGFWNWLTSYFSGDSR